MSSIDKDQVLFNLIHFKSKYLLIDINDAIKELKNDINNIQISLSNNKSKLYKLCLEFNKYYNIDNKPTIKNDYKQENKYNTPEQINEVLKFYPKPDIIQNNDKEEIKQNLTDIRDNIIELNKNLTKKDDNTDTIDLNFTDTNTK